MSAHTDFRLMVEHQTGGLNNWLGTELGRQHRGLFPRLMAMELAELYAELQPTKFRDMDQPLTKQRALAARMELVDCFIVLLGHGCSFDDNARLANVWEIEWNREHVLNKFPSRGDLLVAVDEFRDVVGTELRVGLAQSQLLIFAMCRLLKQFGISLDELLSLFMAKRVLCDFRVNRGYTRGDGYRKVWWYNGFPAPDSLVAIDLIKQVDPRADNAFETLYELMIDVYGQE